MATHLDDDEKGVHSMDTLGGTQRINTVSESGMYALVMRSRKPEARAFRKWVTSEVLPAIRKTGGYIAPTATDEQVDKLITNLKRFQTLILPVLSALQIKSIPIATLARNPPKRASRAFFPDSSKLLPQIQYWWFHNPHTNKK